MEKDFALLLSTIRDDHELLRRACKSRRRDMQQGVTIDTGQTIIWGTGGGHVERLSARGIHSSEGSAETKSTQEYQGEAITSGLDGFTMVEGVHERSSTKSDAHTTCSTNGVCIH